MEIDTLYEDLAKKELKHYFGCSVKRLIGKEVELCYIHADGQPLCFIRKIVNIEFRFFDAYLRPIWEAKIFLKKKQKQGEPVYCLFKLFHPRGSGERPIVSYVPDNQFPFEFARTKITIR